MKKIILVLFMSLGSQNVFGSFESEYSGIMDSVNAIYTPSSGVATNSTLWFYGNERWVTYYSSSKITRADALMGSYLMRVYDLYCHVQGKPTSCLGRGLKITYRLSGSTREATKVISVSINGTTLVSNYFQEMTFKVFEALEKVGGVAQLTQAQQSILYPDKEVDAKVNMYVLFPSSGINANEKWMDTNYIDSIYQKGEANMFGLFKFKNAAHQAIVNDYDYQSKAQYHSLQKYRGLRTEGAVSMVVSGPVTTDAMGLAYLSYSYEPYMVVRSLYNRPENFNLPYSLHHNSLIMIHELAHNMKLGHCSPGQTSICTDNLHKSLTHATKVFEYLKNIGAIRVAYSI